MKIRTAEFLTGAASPRQFPPPVLPEVAFAGKSNVGKSSLINLLLNRKNLVKTSSTPGKTQQINFFLINDAFRLVDLPGYGYAKVPREQKEQWATLVTGYLRRRECLRGVVLLLDTRHDPTELDAQLAGWLAEAGVPMLPVATKADQVSRNKLAVHQQRIAEVLELDAPPLPCSAKSKLGRNELWSRLRPWLEGTSEGKSMSHKVS